MRDKRDALVKRVALDVDVIGRRLRPALDRIVQEKAGPRGTRYDPDATSRSSRSELDDDGTRIPTSSPSDPTGDAAVARASGDLTRTDPALSDLRSLDISLRQIEIHTKAVRALVTKWSTSDPTLADDEGCEIVGGATGVFEPTHRRGFDHDGTLPERFRVGRWSYDFIRRTNRLPTLQEIRVHVEGRRVRP